MNEMLKQAFAEAAKLPEDSQEAIASLVMEEIRSDRGWDERFANSQDLLGALVRQARDDVARGDVLPYDPSNRPAR